MDERANEDKFDNLPYDALAPNSVGVYAGLEWQNFNLFHSRNTSKTGHSVLPQSKPAVAFGYVDHGGVDNLYLSVVIPERVSSLDDPDPNIMD